MRAYYKCRMCGCIYFNGEERDICGAEATISRLAHDSTSRYGGNEVKAREIHYCNGVDIKSAIGIADFIGFQS